jgi:hypothetical protein
MALDPKIKDVLNRYLGKLRSYPNVLNVGIGHKWKGGKKTDLFAIKVYVLPKVPEKMLAPHEILPKELEGVPIDVVELSAPGVQFGETSPSKLHPDIQRRIANGVKI